MSTNRPWTADELRDVANMTPREYEAAHPGERSSAAIHIMRRRLRDQGVELKESPIGRTADPVIVNLPQLPPAPSDDELWEAYDKMYDLQQKHDTSQSMTNARVVVETNRPFGIVFMSDFHLGSKGVDSVRLREDIQLVNSCDNLKAYIGGDGIDNFILPALANVHRDESLVSLEIQYELFKSVINQLLPSLLAVGTGNHDAWTKKMAGIEANLYALAGIPVLHTGEDTYLDLRVGEQEYVVYRKHRPTRTSQYNDGHGVQHMFRFGERPFDVGVMEHHHQAHISSFPAHGEMRWAVRTGSYKIKDGHAREWGYHHGGHGTPVLVFFPYRKSVVPFMSLPDAIDFLEAR